MTSRHVGPESENVVAKSITVQRDAHAAFRVWTEQVAAWWPSGHSISGAPDTQVFFERQVGGRLYERAPDGAEHDWGEIVVWEPPHRLVHTWYLGSSRAQPTKVDVRFVDLGENMTRVEIEHRGPEFIGDLWWQRIAIYNASWEKILSIYAEYQ